MTNRTATSAPAVVDYRSPGTGQHRVQRVVAELAKDETLGGAAIALKLALGVPLCLVGPFVVALIIKAIEFRAGGDVFPGFWLTFLLTAALLVPLLMWTERRTRGEYFSDAMQGQSSPFDSSSYGEYQLQSNVITSIAYTEVALTGPRLVWSAIDGLRGRAPIDDAGRVAAGELVVELLDAGTGIPTRQLIRPGRPAGDVRRLIEYLAAREWVGLSARRDRVWLATPIVRRLGGTGTVR